ncbi:MAG: hypothetical protein K0Q50_564 [Vampirovibrio sp.]|nr:hypothetical protein [Vampirovibrio sp.]
MPEYLGPKHQERHLKRRGGFTLAELLICLAILAEIATFTIPKMLYAQQSQQKKAVLKETIGSISGVLMLGLQSGQLDPTTNMDTYFLSNLNAVKVCPTNAQTEGCWSVAVQGSRMEDNEPGLILHSGAVVVGFGDTSNPANGVMIDWNGTAGPNIQGDDQLHIGYCITTSCSSGWVSGGGPTRPGAIGVDRNATAADLTLFQSLYQ